MHTIALITNLQKEHALDATRALCDALRPHATLCAEVGLRGMLDGVEFLPDAELFARCPLVVALGGDGTIIAAARRCAPWGNGLLGINMGHLGFLATLEGGEVAFAAECIVRDRLTFESRMMLQAQICAGEEVRETHHFLNELVVSRGSFPRLLSLCVRTEREIVNRYRADGLIVATPTGSTAYSLSGGGPLVAPELDLTVLTPICPHSLGARPMIVPSTAPLTVALDAPCDVLVTTDGRELRRLEPREHLLIQKSPYTAKLARVEGRGFYQMVREKLN